MDKKVLYMDFETSGLVSPKHGILSAAFIIEINDEIVEQLEYKLQLFDGQRADVKALEVNGFTLESIKNHDNPLDIYNLIEQAFCRYVDPYNKKDKFTVAGYKVDFDITFLNDFFRLAGNSYGVGSYIDNYRPLCTRALLLWFDHVGLLSLPNYKLKTVAYYFGIEIEAHNAMSDIRATRLIHRRCTDLLKRSL